MLAVVTALYCPAQITTFYIKPIATNIGYDAIQDSNMVVRNSTTNLDKLFLFIGGTGTHTQQYQTISNFAGNLGYDVINLSYPNSVAAASLSGSSDSLVFNTYRQEVCYGTPLSDDVSVDSLNSIYTRTVHLINYLHTTYPSQNWDQYLINPTTLDWSKIAIGGHSQGGGHACYFAKQNDVDRVLMFSSPNDYSDYYARSANWLRTPGVTSSEKHFAFLSLLDEIVPFDKQLTNLEGLGIYPLYDTTYVDMADSPYGNSRCLYTAQAPGLALLYHSSTVKFSLINNAVWTYMLSTVITSEIEEISDLSTLSIYPNPTTSFVRIDSDIPLSNTNVLIQDLSGKTMHCDQLSTANAIIIDFFQLSDGIYFITLDEKTYKIIKH